MAAAEDARPLALVYICSDERFDGEGSRIAELRAHYERLGYRVYFVRVAATANWLADTFEGPHLMTMSRAFLKLAALVHVEAHLTCVGLRDQYYEANGSELPDDKEEEIHTVDLRDAVDPLRAKLLQYGNRNATIVTYLYDMQEAVLDGLFRVHSPI